MAIEQLISAKKLKENPIYCFGIGLLCAIVGILLSLRIFPGYVSIVMITFTILPLVGVMYKLVSDEESQYELHKHVLWHNPILKVFSFLFLGMLVAYTIAFVVIPQPMAEQIFEHQLNTLYTLGGPTAQSFAGICNEEIMTQNNFNYCQSADLNEDGKYEAVYYTDRKPASVGDENGNFYSYDWYVFKIIFLNNLQLLLLIFLLSLIFGAGALFVIAWNASILGVFFGSAIGELVNRTVGAALYSTLPITVWTIWLHGVPEFLAFFLSAISGGTLGIVLIKRKYHDPLFANVVKQSSSVFIASLLLLTMAALIEVYVINF